jgi:gamma-glutamyltranspeptidase/glutathione hydrolase
MKRFAAILVLALVPMAVGAQDTTTVTSTRGMVVSTSSYASDIGAAVLAKGGNAVDAAVATAFALAVTFPAGGNIGGGGFMVIQPVRGEATTIDYRERAPLAATPTMYLGPDGKIDRSLTAAGYLAPGVPGTVRGLAMAHRKYGRLPWREVVLPAAALADGFELPESLARSLNRVVAGPMAPFPASVAAYGKPGGGEWQAGEMIRLTDLAKTLRSIAEGGPDVFYTGWIAEAIAMDMAEHGGLITRKDLEQYNPVERLPIHGTYRGYDIISMGPPSSGGTILVEMLNILEAFDLRSRDRYGATNVHLVLEAMRRGFLDRARWLGDSDFGDIPVDRLTSKTHAVDRAASIDLAHASSSVALGTDIVTEALGNEPEETTHFSVIDADGMAVSNTYTIEGGYGSYVVVPGTGFLLNNEMGDFNKRPGDTNAQGDIGTPPNNIEPGKRMLSSMTPTIVRKDGRTVLITGSPGGRTIINTVLSVVLGVTEFGLSAREAVAAPRMNHNWLPDRGSIEAGALTPEVLARLEAMGHAIRVGERWQQGDASTIAVDPITRVAYGAPDRRGGDSKASVP